jgi:hypothetical protein
MKYPTSRKKSLILIKKEKQEINLKSMKLQNLEVKFIFEQRPPYFKESSSKNINFITLNTLLS